MKAITLALFSIGLGVSLCGCIGSAFSDGRRVIPKQADYWGWNSTGDTNPMNTGAYVNPPPPPEPLPPWAKN